MAQSDHAPLPPSSAAMIWGCPGSVRMQRAQPEQEETEESREGTAAHWVVAQRLMRPGFVVNVGDIADNGVPVTDEMIEASDDIVEDVLDTVSAASPGSILRVEHKVAGARFVHKDFWGTPDAYLLDREKCVLHLWDYKYGHRFVEVFENWQLIGYAACIFETEGVPISDLHLWAVTFTIAQPRCYVRDVLGDGIREWFTKGSTVHALWSNLSAACEVASKPDAPCRTGSHCLDCTAAWDCEANQRVGGAAMDLVHSQQGLGMDGVAIGLEMKMLAVAFDRVKARLNALEAKALSLIDGGQTIAWHGLDWSKPRWVWDKTQIETAAAFVAMFTDGLVKPGVALPTPQQCVKAGVDAAVINPYTTKASAAKKLVRLDDNHAAKVFGNRRKIR